MRKQKETIMEFYVNKDISIMCPSCGKLLLKADKRDERVHKTKCRNCGKWIWFKPSDEDYREIKNVPERHCSSGKRFY